MQIFIKFAFFISISILSACSHSAIKSPFQYQAGKVSGYTALLQQTASCSKSLVPAYTEDLVIESKYDQLDMTKSTLRKSLSKNTKGKITHLRHFIRTLVRYSEYAIQSEKPAVTSHALRCITDNMASWAQAASLLNVETSSTGVAQRKWFLAAVVSTLMKLEAQYTDFILEANTRTWLNNIAKQVINDYDPRLQAKTKYFNNHDLWAAWAVASWAILEEDKAMLTWTKKVFDFSMSRVKVHDSQKVAVFPIELARGRLAVSYSNYALVPLMFLANTYQRNGVNIDQYRIKIRLLANFAAYGVAEPDAILSIIDMPQETTSAGKLIWVLPYVALFGQDNLIKALNQKKLITTKYGQMGGDLKSFYPGWIQ